MRPTTTRAAQAQRGFYLIGLLMVLVIIGILTYRQVGPDKTTGISQARHNIGRAETAACTVNRQVFGSEVARWVAEHPGEQASIERLREAGIRPTACPGGGEITVGADGTVYCSIHAPAGATGSDQPAQLGPGVMPNIQLPPPAQMPE